MRVLGAAAQLAPFGPGLCRGSQCRARTSANCDRAAAARELRGDAYRPARGNWRRNNLAGKISDIENRQRERAARPNMVEKQPHVVFAVDISARAELVVIPGLAAIDALRAAVGMLLTRARAGGELVV